MIIKSHVRGGFRSAADYLKSQGENEKIRTVEISDPDATNLDEAFHNMWAVSEGTRAKKPLHHISINSYKDERLTDAQVLKIAERCEQKYGYRPHDHQRVIVEHVKDGRQHFHVMWNRISLTSGKAVWPGHHWNKSKQAAREMEQELGLKSPTPKRMQRAQRNVVSAGRIAKIAGRYRGAKAVAPLQIRTAKTIATTKTAHMNKPVHKSVSRIARIFDLPSKQSFQPYMRRLTRRRKKGDENIPDSEKMPFRRPEWESAEIIAWAIANGRMDVLVDYGFDFSAPDNG